MGMVGFPLIPSPQLLHFVLLSSLLAEASLLIVQAVHDSTTGSVADYACEVEIIEYVFATCEDFWDIFYVYSSIDSIILFLFIEIEYLHLFV